MKLFAAMVVAFVAFAANANAGMVMTLYTPAAGDAGFSWNGASSASDSYATGGTSLGVYLSIGYGNDYTVGIFEVPISDLVGKPLITATLQVQSLGFDTGYYYGSATIGWLDVAGATGDVVADGMGGPAKGRPGGFSIWNAGLQSYDVTSYVAADLAAGRSFSTFVLSGSRETWGSISAAESGDGPRIVANVVPEPASLGLLVLGSLTLIRRKSVV